MKFQAFLVLALAVGAPPLGAQEPARVELFSPQGTVKQVRQVRALFSEPMVPFADPRSATQPFSLKCPEQGTGRWVDSRNWVYDFDRDLPAGVRCEFRIQDGLRTLAGKTVAGELRFAFSTGGPAIKASIPQEGSEQIDEAQIFLLELDGEATESSVLGRVGFEVEGVAERVGVRLVSGAERDQIVKTTYYRYRKPLHPLLLIQARQRFPAGSKVKLIWGKGVASPSGVATESDLTRAFVTRTPFTASFKCQRENPDADCIPITPVRLAFSAPVAASEARKAVLRGPGNRSWNAQSAEYEKDDPYVQGVIFNGPFPERAVFTLEIPPGLKDDSQRNLANSDKFPLSFRTDAYPSLAKFAADFGVLEAKPKALLPVTLRNVEPAVSARSFDVLGGAENADPPSPVRPEQDVGARLKGRIFQIPPDRAGQMLDWIKKISGRSWDDREKSVFGPVTSAKARAFTVPKLHGPKAFEVVGIPLPKPGFYVVEIESEILGAALLGAPKPMFVPTAVLATNLSVHFKWGLESSLVWVTALDTGKPVSQAAVVIRDCAGKSLWEGQSARDGVARTQGLPPRGKSLQCGDHLLEGGLLVSAQLGDDMAFVHSSWNDGIEPWRFQLPTEYEASLITAHTIFDRTLLRAGETAHMKHLLRRHVSSGFSRVPDDQRPGTVVLTHAGSDQKYEIPLRWDPAGIAETAWKIPREVRLGNYQVTLATKGRDGYYSGEFRVEEYRVPLMKGSLQAPSRMLVAPASVPLDLTVSYLAGGAAGSLPVRVRHVVQPKPAVVFPAFDAFYFSNGKIKEGLTRHGADEGEAQPDKPFEPKSVDLTLDRLGSARTVISGLPRIEQPMDILAELEFRDPNGETQTVSTRIPVYPADRLVGIKPASWLAADPSSFRFQVAVVDLNGKPIAGAPVRVDVFERKTYSHRKRLVGGFYAFEHATEIRRAGGLCEGKTDPRGLLLCDQRPSLSGNVILQATTTDSAGRETTANRDVWVAGKEDWWFAARDSDRIDVIPEMKHYEPGDKARFQVRMPFRRATALVTVEREGIAEVFVRELQGKEPIIEVPVKGSFAPNVFVSVLAVRGRVGGVRPTATVDLGRPAYKLGIAEIRVGWKAHELKVKVSTDRPVYRVREKARVDIVVTTAEGTAPPAGTEVALAAVDEGLLELQPNTSWQLLDAMMRRRGCGVETSTAQMHVIGKRHFGLKALPQGGGGGKQATRELFDTLLLWKGRVSLDGQGRASVDVPLNDSLTSFRIVAVATALDRFGTGSATIRSTQELMILSGIAPVVRQGDQFRATFTVRNTTEQSREATVSTRVKGMTEPLQPTTLKLAPGASQEIAWTLTVPAAVDALTYEVEARDGEGAADRLSVTQKVVPAVAVRPFQSVLVPVEGEVRLDLERPNDALPGRGGILVSLKPTLVDGLNGVTDYMRSYPYTCLEQEVSRAVALRDLERWNRLMALIPAYLDSDGLAKYFPANPRGSDVLTSYILAIAHDAGWQVPNQPRKAMTEALQGFVAGRIILHSPLAAADLAIRKLSALNALSRWEKVEPVLLSAITIEPTLWPTSAVIDWFELLRKVSGIRNQSDRLREADQILRSRLNFQGTTMGFSTERSDFLWWLMVSNDTNAVRLLRSVVGVDSWREDLPRLIRGSLARQRRGHWDTTVANAWGVVAMESFSQAMEKTAVTGATAVTLTSTQTVNWNQTPAGKALSFPWPAQRSSLSIRTTGTGRPWATVQSLAAIPLRQPLSSGFKIRKTLTAVEQKRPGIWSRGDVIRVRLILEASSDMTWVVVSDPVPGGGSILGSGLGRDSQLLTRAEERKGWVWPAFEERSAEAFRAYYEYVPKGEWTVEYTMRLNSEGLFALPTTRVEAMYSPEMFGEAPNEAMRIQ